MEVGLTGKHIGGIVRLLAVWLWRLVVTMVQYARFRAGISLALDSEMYFGRSEKVRKLLVEGEYRSPFTAYYYNLLNAQQNRLPDRLMDGYQPASQGLFLPVAPHSTYLTIYAANEVWFALGDMTMAEHAAILGMIFLRTTPGQELSSVWRKSTW